jgi:hypothetical protein
LVAIRAEAAQEADRRRREIADAKHAKWNDRPSVCRPWNAAWIVQDPWWRSARRSHRLLRFGRSQLVAHKHAWRHHRRFHSRRMLLSRHVLASCD